MRESCTFVYYVVGLFLRLPLACSFVGISNRHVHQQLSNKETLLHVQISPQGADLGNQIFCNVELNAENLEAVGFDMDFTLAQYNEAFDLLAFDGAKERLCKLLGYPKEVLEFKYRSERSDEIAPDCYINTFDIVHSSSPCIISLLQPHAFPTRSHY